MPIADDRRMTLSGSDAGISVPEGSLWPRWLFLRALGLIFLSAFYSLAFQIHGLVGERGILPAGEYLYALRAATGVAQRIWLAPTLFWLGAGDGALWMVIAAGLLCSLLLTANVWPRLTVALCTLLFLSCVAVLQDFSSYQSDGMLLEAGFLSLFFAPAGVHPGLGAENPPSRFSRFMLEWEWFRIYFESGVVKLGSGDPHWRNLTAMDEYYQNGPLPTWIGWYVQHLPHWYHAGTVILTLVVELFLVWAVFLPRRFRIACFVVVTALQVGIIATANYAFLNYLVLALGVLLLDDRAIVGIVGHVTRLAPRWRTTAKSSRRGEVPLGTLCPSAGDETGDAVRRSRGSLCPRGMTGGGSSWRGTTGALARHAENVILGFLLYATVVAFIPLGALAWPARVLEPFRIANAYGLFAVMTEARYEIEFQGSRDGTTWVAYPFRYKPQDVMERPGIYAPYQPRFDWNLWFASLGPWQQSQWVVLAQQRLVEGSPSVLRLFRSDPFRGRPPALVRTVLYQYWFTDLATKRATGAWWRREERGPFTGVVSGSPRPVTAVPPPVEVPR